MHQIIEFEQCSGPDKEELLVQVAGHSLHLWGRNWRDHIARQQDSIMVVSWLAAVKYMSGILGFKFETFIHPASTVDDPGLSSHQVVQQVCMFR